MTKEEYGIRPKFNKTNQAEFFKILNTRVNQYFKDSKKSKQANAEMVLKTIFMLSLYFVPFILLLMGVFSSFIGMMTMWILMGLGMAGIGLCVMHDANHGSYSKHTYVNLIIGSVINFMGSFHSTWKIQHNVLHHSYTNIHGFDEDTDNEVLRFSPNQKLKSFNRFQAYYAPFLYCLMSLNRFLVKDFKQLSKYHKNGLLKSQNISYKSALMQMLFYKALYILLTLVLPAVLLTFPFWQLFVGFLVMHFVCGFILAIIFQSAHILEDTEFFVSGEDGTMENSWAIHQIRTTANFAGNSPLFSWFIGGLNYQIEHHLFPNICHVHYRHIAGIVKQTTHEYDLPYHHYGTFYAAFKNHFAYLDKLGKGEA